MYMVKIVNITTTDYIYTSIYVISVYVFIYRFVHLYLLFIYMILYIYVDNCALHKWKIMNVINN